MDAFISVKVQEIFVRYTRNAGTRVLVCCSGEGLGFNAYFYCMFRLHRTLFILLGMAMSQLVLGQAAELSFPKRQKVALIGSSMQGWLEPGDSLDLMLDETFSMALKLGDFAIVAKGGNPKIPLLKKVVGLPGDSIGFAGEDSSVIAINGLPIVGADGQAMRLPRKRKYMVLLILHRIKGRIPTAFYWVSGSRPGTHDSTLFGPVSRKQILGTASRSSVSSPN